MPRILPPNRAGPKPKNPTPAFGLDVDTLASMISAARENLPDEESLHSMSYHLVGSIDEDRTREVSSILREANNSELSHIWLFITSSGGVLDYALGLYDAIRCLRHQVYTVVAGSADSAATLVALAGDRRFILPNATMTIHSPSTECGGETMDMADVETVSKRLLTGLNDILAIYAERTKLSRSKLEKLCRAATTLSAKDALRYGFVHKIVPHANKPKRRVPSPFRK